MTHRLLVTSATCLFVVATGLAQQPNPPVPRVPGTGTISGVAIDAETSRPLTGVVIYLGPPARGQTGEPLRTLTDARGRFVFTDLAVEPDGYFINASKFGYLEGHYGTGAGGQLGSRIFIKEGEWFDTATIRMSRPGVITGTVTDERGEPVVGAFVRALAQVSVAGRTSIAAGPTTKTDDRGVYRLANLLPGKYLVNVPSVQAAVPPTGAMTPAPSAMFAASALTDPTFDVDATTRLVIGRYPMPPPSTDGRMQAYAPVFYPSATTVANAQAIEIKGADDRQGIDIQLQALPTARVRGVVQGPADAIAGLLLRLMASGSEDLGTGGETATTLVAADGTFAFPGVPAGSYVIDARATISEFNLQNPLGAPIPPSLPAAAGGARGGGGGSTIVMAGPAGLYFSSRSGRGSGAYWGRSAVDVGPRDATGVIVTMQRAVSLSGRIVMETAAATPGNPAPQAPIMLEAADGSRALGMLRSTPDRSDPSAFTFEGLMAGQYFLRPITGLVKSIVWDGRDMTTTPFDATTGRDFTGVTITMTDKRITLTGVVRDDRGIPAKDAVVIAFPAEREQWTNFGFNPPRIRAYPAGTTGTYRYQNLPAGDYLLVAVPSVQNEAWKNSRFLEAAARAATPVTLAWGETKSADLKVSQIK